MCRFILAIVVSLLVAGHLSAQARDDSWNNLKQLQVGQKIEIVDMNLKSVKGTFISFSEGAISLQTSKGEVAISHADVFRVSSREGSKRMRNMLIGMGIGTAGGLAAGLRLMERETGYAGAVAGTTALFAGVGIGIGAALPAGTRTIYRAPQRRSEGAR